MTSTPRSTTFETTLAGSGGKTGIVVPPDAVEQLAAGKRPPVLVDVNGYPYRSTVAVMGRQHMVAVSAAVRAATGLAAALAADEQVGAFFATLANSLQRYHVDSINGAKTAETRQRRVDEAVALFRSGQKP